MTGKINEKIKAKDEVAVAFPFAIEHTLPFCEQKNNKTSPLVVPRHCIAFSNSLPQKNICIDWFTSMLCKAITVGHWFFHLVFSSSRFYF